MDRFLKVLAGFLVIGGATAISAYYCALPSGRFAEPVAWIGVVASVVGSVLGLRMAAKDE